MTHHIKNSLEIKNNKAPSPCLFLDRVLGSTDIFVRPLQEAIKAITLAGMYSAISGELCTSCVDLAENECFCLHC